MAAGPYLSRERFEGRTDQAGRGARGSALRARGGHRIVVVGGGAGGSELATRLGDSVGRRGAAEITLIDCARTHVWKPLYHQVAAGTLNPCSDELEFQAQARWHHFNFRLGRVEALDRAQRVVHVAATVDDEGEVVTPPRSFGYDTLVIAVGSVANDFGIPGVKEHCHFLDTLEQAEYFNSRLVNAFLRAQTQSKPVQPGQLTIAIVGTGATGVELAAELHEFAEGLSMYGLNRIDPERNVRIVLIGGGERLLPGLPERLSDAIARELERLHVECHTGEWVSEVTRDGIRTKSGLFVATCLPVWAGGIKAPPFLADLDGLETNKLDQLVVRATLQTTRDDDIFAFGDCAAAPWQDGKTVPPRAQAAQQQAKFLAKALRRRIRGRPIGQFTFRDRGSLVSLGRYDTIGNLMGAITGGNLFIEGLGARAVYEYLYKRHQVTLFGIARTALTTLAEMLTRPVRPRIKLH